MPALRRSSVLCSLLVVGAIVASRTAAQETSLPERAVVARLIEQLESSGLDAEALAARRTAWGWPRDPSRLYLFAPASGAGPERIPFASEAERELRSAAAAELFDRAIALADQERDGDAYRLIFETLAIDPEHPQAAAVLGPTRRAFATDIDESKVAVQNRPERTYGWSGGEWRRLETDHFSIIGTADAAEIRRVAQQLERLYAAWDLAFFDVWSPPGRLARAIRDGKPLARVGSRKSTVVLFADREQYVARLSGIAPVVDQSRGYYAPTRRQSMFFPDDSPRPTSLLHEVTHQLFQERSGGDRTPGDRANFWLIEGIAALLESCVDHEDFLTIGGGDAERLQYARFHLFSGQKIRPFDELAGLGQQTFQSDPDVRALYSQGAGICAWLMADESGERRLALMRLLDQVYAGKDRPDELTRATGLAWDDAVRAYIEFLRPRKAQFDRFPPAADSTCLAFPYGDVDDATIEGLPELSRLAWLDLSRAPISDRSAPSIARFTALEQLFLEGTATTDRGLAQLAPLQQLRELDLGGTRVTARGLSELAKFPKLEALVLSDLPLDDDILPLLERLPALRQVELDGTRIAPEKIADLQRRLAARGER
ncbi:MAG TPA: hypothetical protein DCQ98_09675 [Planctomycetaceae bacterium]|nr:hypothetical protein [Planctomycetaceae bacterium]HRF02667.1 hypothetical protein [Pirellulaceae bacterium]